MTIFSQIAVNSSDDEIRKFLKLLASPSIISFAGGIPNNDFFPTDAVDAIYGGLSSQQKKEAFQYCPTRGYPALIETLKRHLAESGLPMQGNELMITTGAIQALDHVARVLVDPGETVVTENPAFVGGLAAFRAYGAELRGVELDDEGMIIDQLTQVLAQAPSTVKMLYINPHFQNPGGVLWSPARKRELIRFLAGKGLMILEDDPYRDLYFDEEAKADTVPIKALAGIDQPACYVGSFSKIFGPGMRLGYLLGPSEVVDRCELAKQTTDACSSAFTQVLANQYLSQGYLPTFLASVRGAYKERAEAMLAGLEDLSAEGVRWSKPRGGFFIWVTLPDQVDASQLLVTCVRKGAAFVPGKAFDPQGRRRNCMRLAYSNVSQEQIERGMAIVREAIREHLRVGSSN